MDQLSFTDIPPVLTGGVRRTDPDTSREAAKSVDVRKLEALVLEALKVRPMSIKELAWYLNLEVVSVSPRLKPLRTKGLVRDSGKRRDKSTVWEAVR